jgi:salicylate hydroxylase
MKACHDGIYEAFQAVCTRNLWPSKEKVWFDYIDGFHSGASHAFTVSNSVGQNGVHRAHFLEKLVPLFSKERAFFGKRLLDIAVKATGRLALQFEDGSSAEADAVVGCDGIKSRVRQILFGTSHPCATPSYTHKYAYRGLVPMEDAIAAIGEERAHNACMHVSLLFLLHLLIIPS